MTMQMPTRKHGFTLIELMIAVAIIGIIAAVAIPAYNGYIETARVGMITQNIDSMRVFQEDWKLRKGTYAQGAWNPSANTWTSAAAGNFEWIPNGDNGETSYTVALQAGGGYKVTAVDQSITPNRTVVRCYPESPSC